MSDQPGERIVVWDLSTRVFHWLLAFFVIASFFTGEDEGLLFRIHTYFGYAILILLLFRIAWGVIGGEYARFSDFVKPWSEVKAYLRTVIALSPPRYTGHNPAGGWMIVVMLVTLFLIVITGMMAAVSEGATMPFFDGLPRAISRLMNELHEGLGNAMMGLVGLHLLGVAVDWFLTRDNLVRAMIDGTKEAEPGARAAGRVGLWRALMLIALLAALAVYLVAQTSF